MMQKEEGILPKEFDGTFKFTNFTDEEFVGTWNNVAYTFPPNKTSPIIIGDATPLQIQSIRKKFARDLAIVEWYKSPKFVGMNTHTPGGTPALYTDNDLAPFIQRCLEPLPMAQVTATVLPRVDVDAKLSVDRRGKKVTRILQEGESLRESGSEPLE